MQQIINFSNCGECSNCGGCCTEFLNLDQQEITKIDLYLKNHKIKRYNTEPNNFICPFRNNYLRKCEIYEVRPYICQLFKCNVPIEKAIIKRDEINKNKKVRSMSELFFKDNSKISTLEKIGIKVYKRGE